MFIALESILSRFSGNFDRNQSRIRNRFEPVLKSFCVDLVRILKLTLHIEHVGFWQVRQKMFNRSPFKNIQKQMFALHLIRKFCSKFKMRTICSGIVAFVFVANWNMLCWWWSWLANRFRFGFGCFWFCQLCLKKSLWIVCHYKMDDPWKVGYPRS